jgi:hypothetical protein
MKSAVFKKKAHVHTTLQIKIKYYEYDQNTFQENKS